MKREFEHFGVNDVKYFKTNKLVAEHKIKVNPAIRCYIYNICIAVFLLSVTLPFSSCKEIAIIDDFQPDIQHISVKDGNINFLINFGTYGDDQDVSTRSDAVDSEPETVVVELDNGMSMFATLTAASESVGTRSAAVGLRAFNNSALLQIVAYEYNVSGPSYYDHVEFEVDITDDNLIPRLTRISPTPITLDIGKSYRFIAYSYNNNTAAMPAIYPPPGPIGVDPNEVDLIWGACDTVKVTETGQQQVTINVHHLFSKVTVHATSATNITTLTGVEMPGCYAAFTIDSGKITPGTAVDQPFTFSPGAATTKSSDPRIVYTGGSAATIVKVGSVSISGASQPSYDNLFATFAKKLKSGYAYDLTIKFGDALDLDDDTPPTGFIPYVGAFWKDDQFGERLIRIKRPTGSTVADSVWTAVVVSGAGWIALDTLRTSDTVWEFGTPTWEGNMMGFDAGPRLVSPGTYVSGYMDNNNPYIYFRIGLSGPNPTPGTPRYGMVLLTYANNKKRQRIWIRQGEAPDYVMLPNDPVTTGGLVNRNKASKISPYNLTAATLNSKVDSLLTIHIVNPSDFTPYPTMAGAYFQWANYGTRMRWAWPPNGTTVSGWTTTAATGYWDDIAEDHEICPFGYRRLTDGRTDMADGNPDMSLSELRQSLFLDPIEGYQNFIAGDNMNYMFGYYADGYFDRYAIVSSATSELNSTVSYNTARAAYRGVLFYNPLPNRNESLFFPSAGSRLNTNGSAYEFGSGARYWTSSSDAPTTANAQEGYDYVSGAYTAWLNRSFATPIRCTLKPMLKAIPQDYIQELNDADPGDAEQWNRYDSYLLDGSTYTVKVISTAPWRIKAISGTTKAITGYVGNESYMLNMQPSDDMRVGTTGVGAMAGEDVTFTVVNNKTYWGYIDVVFESPAGEFADVTLTLVFAWPRLKLLNINSNSTYGQYGIADIIKSRARWMLMSKNTFGTDTTSMIYSRGFNFDRVSGGYASADEINKINKINTFQPDIIVLSYNERPTEGASGTAAAYANYVKSGKGVLIALLEYGTWGINYLMREVFEDPNINQYSYGAAGWIYNIIDQNDIITNGLFGNVGGKYWGEDQSVTICLDNFEPYVTNGTVTPYSRAYRVDGNSVHPTNSTPLTASVTSFRHNSLPFFFIGDAGFINGYNANNIARGPFAVTNDDGASSARYNPNLTYFPVPKQFGNGTPKYTVYNSQMFANIMVWAMTQVP